MKFSVGWLGPGVCAMWAVLVAIPASASVFVQFETTEGNFIVELFDEDTPLTVANFLGYTDRGDYDDTLIHRSARRSNQITPFVIQGGGWEAESFDPLRLTEVPAGPSVVNEPKFTNTRGTISMAKLRNAPDSATNEWFISVNDNDDILDDQNGGFTVFGRVLEPGMNVVDTVVALPAFDLRNHTQNGAMAEVPLREFSIQDAQNSVPIEPSNLVLVRSVTRINQLGDATNDGMVSADDLGQIAANGIYGAVGTGPNHGLLYGDGNDDGMVTGGDLIAAQQHFGQSLPGAGTDMPALAPSVPSAAPVPAPLPEPTSLALVAAGLGFCGCRIRP